MRSYFYKSFFLAAMIWFAASLVASANEASADDPDATVKALRLLFTISNESIPKTSTCFGFYGQRGRAMVKDLLATEFNYLFNGNNVIKGSCDAKYCTLTINHDAGEDVSSADIKFAVKNDKAQVASLECVITP